MRWVPKRAGERYFFVHIPKTGGTTIEKLLKSGFGEDAVCPFYWEGGYLGRDPRKIESFKVYAGHSFHYLSTALPKPLRIFTIIREPLARVLSSYREFISNPKNEYLVRSGFTLQNAIRDEKFRVFANDHQTRFLGTRHDFKSDFLNVQFGRRDLKEVQNELTQRVRRQAVDGAMLERAKATLGRAWFVGVTDELELSATLLMSKIGLGRMEGLPRLKATKPVTGATAATVTEELRQEIIDLNRYDTILYEHAKKLFAKELETAGAAIAGLKGLS